MAKGPEDMSSAELRAIAPWRPQGLPQLGTLLRPNLRLKNYKHYFWVPHCSYRVLGSKKPCSNIYGPYIPGFRVSKLKEPVGFGV